MTSATVQVAGRLPAKSLVVVHTGGNDFIQKYSASWVLLSLRPLGFEISPGLRSFVFRLLVSDSIYTTRIDAFTGFHKFYMFNASFGKYIV